MPCLECQWATKTLMFEKEYSLLNRSALDSKSLKSRYIYKGSDCHLDGLIPFIENRHAFCHRVKQTFYVI